MIKRKLTAQEEKETYIIQATATQWIGFARLLSEALPDDWRKADAETDEETSKLLNLSLPVMRALSQVLIAIEDNHMQTVTQNKRLN